MIDKILKVLEESKYQHMEETDQSKGKPQPRLFREYQGERTKLPDINHLEHPNMSLHEAIQTRTSHRKFVQKPLNLEDLSYALWATQGVKKVVQDRATFRHVPSAGARHAFETYLLVNHVEDVESGLYAYDPQTHELVYLQSYDSVRDRVLAGCINQRMVVDAAVTFFWIADIYRMSYRYGERAYRYLLLDAGHICQNLYLVAEALGAKTCAIGAFDDDVLNEALAINTEDSAVLYAAPLGYKAYED